MPFNRNAAEQAYHLEEQIKLRGFQAEYAEALHNEVQPIQVEIMDVIDLDLFALIHATPEQRVKTSLAVLERHKGGKSPGHYHV
jgi:methionine synthase II (cobalamin-independent)